MNANANHTERNASFSLSKENEIAEPQEDIHLFIRELRRRMDERLINFRKCFKEEDISSDSMLSLAKTNSRF